MAQKDDIAQQRDRFLAFAFASSDLLMEVGGDQCVTFVSGAVKQLTGFDDQGIRGKIWTDLFLEGDRGLLKSMIQTIPPGRRCGPVQVTMQDNNKKKTSNILFSAIKMPDRDELYITLAYPSALDAPQEAAESKKEAGKPLVGKEDFVKVARDAIRTAKEQGQDVTMTLLEVPGLKELKERVPKNKWDEALAQMADLLKSQSLGGQTATQLSAGQYGLVHDKTTQSATIEGQVADLLKKADPEGKGADVKGSAIDADIGKMNDKEAARALMYTLNSFEKNGTKLTLKSLNEGFKTFLKESTKKIQQFKNMAVKADFYLNFQPIVSLSTLNIGHYEILTRFRDGGSPYEWITFGEEVGMAAEFDIAVCTQSIRYILKQPPGSKFAVNVSGQSIQNDQFIDDLRRAIGNNKVLAESLMFEITESANIRELDKVNNFIGALQKDGFKVCLDDFGAGSASFQYLHKLHVDYVKLDGSYVQQLLGNKRNETMVRSLAQLCSDLEVSMVAEHIETMEEAALLRDMKIAYGQGYWFSKPLPTPDYEPDPQKLQWLLAGTA